MITSCNGCRVLRKGCSDNCLLRQSLSLINSPKAQSNATLFVSKFFGRAPLLSLLESSHPSLRPVMFQSLLYEACGRTINPVTGAVGLMYSGKWSVCQLAVDTVLRGGKPALVKEYLDGQSSNYYTENENVSDEEIGSISRKKRKFDGIEDEKCRVMLDLDLRLMTTRTFEEYGTTSFESGGGGGGNEDGHGIGDEVDDDNGKTLTLFC